MKKKEIQTKKLILETLLELLYGVRNYEPDKWVDDFMLATEKFLSEVNILLTQKTKLK